DLDRGLHRLEGCRVDAGGRRRHEKVCEEVRTKLIPGAGVVLQSAVAVVHGRGIVERYGVMRRIIDVVIPEGVTDVAAAEVLIAEVLITEVLITEVLITEVLIVCGDSIRLLRQALRG